MSEKRIKTTSEELGKMLYRHVKFWADNFFQKGSRSAYLSTLNLDALKKENAHPYYQEDLIYQELVIAFMWITFDALQKEEYRQVLTVMHGNYMRDFEYKGKRADEELKHLEQRYKEYKEHYYWKDIKKRQEEFKKQRPEAYEKLKKLGVRDDSVKQQPESGRDFSFSHVSHAIADHISKKAVAEKINTNPFLVFCIQISLGKSLEALANFLKDL